jgi:hypothetical protein
MSESVAEGELQYGDVFLYHGTSLVGRAIRFFDGTEVNHAGLFLDGAQVGEAIGRGLVTQPLDRSVRDAEWVLVRRLPDVPADVEPLRARASRYLAQGNRYGYEQILLLAFLCLTRKVKVTPALRPLIRATLDRAASFLNDLGQGATGAGGREPMICSEFVYRSYDEALPAREDPFTIRIAVDAPGRRGIAPMTTAARGRGIHPESVLARTLAKPPAARPRGRRGLAAPAAGGPDLDPLIERYLQEVKTARPGLRAESPRDAAVDEAVQRFAVALAAADGGNGGSTRRAKSTRRGLAAQGVNPALANLARVAADFVTPGDLLRSGSLMSLGTLERQ